MYEINKKIICFVVILYYNGVMSCEIHHTCYDCIRDPNVCVWCASNSFINETRCKPAGSDYSWCDSNLENPSSSAVLETTSDDKHITPESYKISLRPGQPTIFSFSVRRRQEASVDLYFLIDASNSMITKRKLALEQSGNFYHIIKNMTNDVYVGVGSFVDKNILPYTVDVAANKSYSFRHHMKLANSYERFQASIKGLPLGENRDPPEATLEAIAQAIACKNEIGWRADSRKILVVMTDAEFHSAGDGKVAGIFRPYDGGCYTENGVYTKELEMDYPSLSMINRLANDNNIIVIFAVTQNMRRLYVALSKIIKGSKVVFVNHANSFTSDIGKIYKEVDATIMLNINAKQNQSEHFEIKLHPDCTDKQNSACKFTAKNDNEKQFLGTIKLKKYEEYNNTEIDITMDGVKDKLTLNVDIINTCECQKHIELNSKYCNNEKQECGVCKCEHVGENCQCLPSECPVYEGAVCASHGKCQCTGECKCDDGWFGDDCRCNASDEACPGS